MSLFYFQSSYRLHTNFFQVVILSSLCGTPDYDDSRLGPCLEPTIIRFPATDRENRAKRSTASATRVRDCKNELCDQLTVPQPWNHGSAIAPRGHDRGPKQGLEKQRQSSTRKHYFYMTLATSVLGYLCAKEK